MSDDILNTPTEENAVPELNSLTSWEAVSRCLEQRDLKGARAALLAICRDTPELAEGWINLGSVERELDELSEAASHLEKGVSLLSARPGAPDPLLLPAWLSLAEIYEILEDVTLAERALRQAFLRAPEMASAFIQLAGLKARMGDIAGAKKAAREYCMAAVSILSEKASIGLVRKFQKALDKADTVDGRLLLIATREAAVMAFDRALEALKAEAGSAVQAEPVTADGHGDNAFAMKRADARITATNEARELLSAPVYGFPGNSPAAREVLFTVPAAIGAEFPVFVCTRTAWNRMQIRLRFADARGSDVLQLAVPVFTDWFRKGFAGAFSDGQGRGFFHSMASPVPLGERGIRFEIDLGLSFQKAIDALISDLNALHRRAPIDKLVFGDGLLG